jgi:hypothetical protein
LTEVHFFLVSLGALLGLGWTVRRTIQISCLLLLLTSVFVVAPQLELVLPFVVTWLAALAGTLVVAEVVARSQGERSSRWIKAVMSLQVGGAVLSALLAGLTVLLNDQRAPSGMPAPWSIDGSAFQRGVQDGMVSTYHYQLSSFWLLVLATGTVVWYGHLALRGNSLGRAFLLPAVVPLLVAPSLGLTPVYKTLDGLRWQGMSNPQAEGEAAGVGLGILATGALLSLLCLGGLARARLVAWRRRSGGDAPSGGH